MLYIEKIYKSQNFPRANCQVKLEGNGHSHNLCSAIILHNLCSAIILHNLCSAIIFKISQQDPGVWGVNYLQDFMKVGKLEPISGPKYNRNCVQMVQQRHQKWCPSGAPKTLEIFIQYTKTKAPLSGGAQVVLKKTQEVYTKAETQKKTLTVLKPIPGTRWCLTQVSEKSSVFCSTIGAPPNLVSSQSSVSRHRGLLDVC